MTSIRFVFVVARLMMFTVCAFGQGEQAKPGGAEVTIKGVMMTEASGNLSPEKDADKTIVLFALEGTPAIAAAVDSIMKEDWPGESIDADQARKIQEDWVKKLKYYVAPGDFTAKKENIPRWRNPAKAVSGVISEKDGKKWITASKIEPARLKFPDKMLALPKPFAMPGKKPLLLKISDSLSLKCILLPAGRYFAGIPYYFTYFHDGSEMRYDDDYAYMITLTKPFYMAETPVTQEMWESVMSNNPSQQIGPQIAVQKAPCTDIRKFCKLLSERTGRTVRLPTQAEQEYAARVGTSAPPYNGNYADQANAAPDGKTLLPVKSKKPNAWGLYDMFGCAWEMIGDIRQVSRKDTIDPHYPTPCETAEPPVKKHDHNSLGRNDFSWAITREGVGNGTGTGYTLTIFRLVVEATPEEIAELAKAQAGGK